MSYVDQPERPSRSISERFQDVWDHPTPFGLLAQIKGLMNLPQTIRDMVDSSRIVTGPAPTTEEEAYIYHQAREYLPRAGFELASAASPTVPKVVGRLPVRPNGGSTLRAEGPSQPTNGVLSSDLRPARPEPYAQPPAVLRPGAGEGGASGVLGGWTSSPAELPWWMQALLPPGAMPVGPLPAGPVARQALPPTALGANRHSGIPNTFGGKPIPEIPPPRPPFAPEASSGGRLPPSIVGLAGLPSDYRELRRVDANSRDAALARPDGEAEPGNEIESPPLAPEQEPPTRDLTLLPWILRRKLVSDEPSEGQDGALSSQRSPQPPANPSGNQPPAIVGPAILEKVRGREDSFDGESQVSVQSDPNHRELRTVSPNSEEVGSTSDLFDPSLIGWRKKRKKTVRRGSFGKGSFPRTSSFAGNGNNGTGGKGPGANGGDDDDYCMSRMWEEKNECHKRSRNGEYAHPHHYGGCLNRASERWDACNRNGGTPPPWEPKKWSMDPDEEVFINIGR